MKFVVWGAGKNGEKIGKKVNVVAFIDSDLKRVGKYFLDRPIISFEEYKVNFRECYIIVSPSKGFESIIKKLDSEKIYRYFVLSRSSVEIKDIDDNNSWKDMDFQYKDNILIYGLTLTGLILYQHLKKIKKNVKLIPHERADRMLADAVKTELTYDLIFDLKEAKLVEQIFFTTLVLDENMDEKYIPSYLLPIISKKEELDRLKEKTERVIDIFSKPQCFAKGGWRDTLNDMRNKLRKFKNCHLGERCFIIGNGPSLRMSDLEKLFDSNEISIGVNSVFSAFQDTYWRPSYYVTGDYLQIYLYADEILHMPAKAKFISKLPYIPKSHLNIEALHKIDGLENNDIYRFYLRFCSGFSNDFSEESYTAGTIIYVCIQLAFYMGFHDIYLLGIDFDYTSTKEHPMAYFSKDYATKEKMLGIFTPENIDKSFDYEDALFGYHTAKNVAKKRGIRIYNATRGGKLDVFERVEFDGLFDRNRK